MLNIKIDNPDLEKNIKQTFGNDVQSLSLAFTEFVKQRQIRQDIKISIKQLDNGEVIEMKDVFGKIRSKV
jgi:hypothetical protein